MSAPRLVALLLALIAGVASGATGGVRLVWSTSGAPAEGLEASFDDGGETRRVVSAGDGRIDAPAAARLRIVDPESRLVLIDSVEATEVIRVPEPIRVRGSIAGAAGALTVRIGDGNREDARERWLRTTGRRLVSRDDDEAFGLELPKSASRWHSATLEGASFVSDWIVSDPPPQLVAFDASGNAIVRELAVRARPRATIDAGEIGMRPAPGLDVALVMPSGTSPASVMILAGDATIAAERRMDVASQLAVFDQIDRRLFELLVLRHPYGVGYDGRASLRWLPPLDAFEIALVEPWSELHALRNVSLSAGRTSVVRESFAALTQRENAPRRDVKGSLTLAGTQKSVSGATVVLSDPPERYETTTGSDGAFVFRSVRTDRPVTLFVDAHAHAPASHRSTQLFREVELPQDAALSLGVADPPSTGFVQPQLGPSFAGCSPVIDPQYPFAYATLNGGLTPAANYTVSLIDDGKVTITYAEKGRWQFFMFVTPFLQYTTNPVNLPSGLIGRELTLDIVGGAMQQVTLTVTITDNPPETPVDIQFSAPLAIQRWFDPTTIGTNAAGVISIPCANVPNIFIQATEPALVGDDPYWCDEASIPVSATAPTNCTIALGKGAPCACQ